MIYTTSKRIPTFIDGNFKGYLDASEIVILKNEAYKNAVKVQRTEKADHMIYGYFDINSEGKVSTARLYSGIAQDDDKFQSVTAKIPSAHIYAIHKNGEVD